jgi:hypothetical protein
MSTKTKTNVESRKRDYETAVLDRYTLLKDRGLEETDIRKDSHLKLLKAKAKQMQRRLSAISHIEKQYEAVSLRKKEHVIKEPEKKAPLKKAKNRPAENQSDA